MIAIAAFVKTARDKHLQEVGQPGRQTARANNSEPLKNQSCANIRSQVDNAISTRSTAASPPGMLK
jgi:hypothetical protein